jgi:DNA repair protein RecN (Recombination protein N)
LAHVQDSLCQADQKLKDLDAAEIRLEELKDALEILEQKNRGLAEELSLARKVAAKNFEKEMTEQLRSLNMPKIVFEVVIEPQRISKNGFDKIEFFLTPNVGEYRIPVKDCASGGELSRLMLALQALLAGKGGIPILVFDEIDSNIGGTTATIVGEKLGEIGSCHQVLCITHYPQVAKHANYHLQISKQEIEGRTFTSIKTLDKESQAFELSRMQGM